MKAALRNRPAIATAARDRCAGGGFVGMAPTVAPLDPRSLRAGVLTAAAMANMSAQVVGDQIPSDLQREVSKNCMGKLALSEAALRWRC